MSARISLRIAAALLITLTLLAAVGTKLTAQQDSLTVHEWGTFTSVSRADGTPQRWNPLSGASDLPEFVYRAQLKTDPKCLKCGLALVRMETPVLYFYATRETDVAVKVGFPRGLITEWYPQSVRTNPGVDWGRLTILPGTKADFPVTRRESHYYPARETDAAPIRVGAEHEKFLFYRGTGNFELPLRVSLADNKVTVKNLGPDEIAQVIVFENRAGRSAWRIYQQLKGEVTLDRPAPDQPVESLLRELESVLTAQGLYKKEAAAMVKTWRDSWFEEGLRVFYLVPRRSTDAILPLTISPAPRELSRVLVGRAEIITPEMDQAIRAAGAAFSDDSSSVRAAAVSTIRRYGRFAEPVLREMMAQGNAERVTQLMNLAMKAPAVGN